MSKQQIKQIPEWPQPIRASCDICMGLLCDDQWTQWCDGTGQPVHVAHTVCHDNAREIFPARKTVINHHQFSA